MAVATEPTVHWGWQEELGGLARQVLVPDTSREMLEQERRVKRAKEVEALQSVSRDMSSSPRVMLMLE